MMRRMRYSGSDVAADIRAHYGPAGELADLYAATEGAVVHKWHHYIPLYERYLGPWRGRPVRLLEIGVAQGGSLALWRRWLGPEAVIFGIDIRPKCAAFDGQAGRVRIGSQDDPAFLARVVEEMGGLDVVIDDGSHRMEHIRASLEALFPRLAEGGIYLIEDLHTAYWPKFGGGLEAEANLFNLLRPLADDMHRWYHRGAPRLPGIGPAVAGLHLHDSMLVLEKRSLPRPTHSYVGERAARATAMAGAEAGEAGDA